MLKFFFNRQSPLVLGLNAGAFLETLAILYLYARGSLALGPASIFLIASWWILNLCNFYPWYAQRTGPDGRPEKLGIRLHFSKAMIPYIYVLFFSLLAKLLGVSEWILGVFCVLFLPLYYVNVILLYFHFRDESSLTPGYFSHNFYRKDEEPPCTP